MYVRKLKKGGKTYSYYYKSQRIGDKVKSIYVGKAVEDVVKPVIKKEIKREFRKDDNSVANNLIEFDNLLEEINKLIMSKDLNNAIHVYNRIFDVYKNMDLEHQDKIRLFKKLNDVYNNLAELGKESKINIS